MSDFDEPAGPASGGSRPASFAASPAGPAASSGAADPAPAAAPSGGSADPAPGWNAFAGSDGAAGLSRTPRDLLNARTATAEPDAHASDAATAPNEPGHPQSARPHASVPPNFPSPSSPSHQAPSPMDDDTAPTEPVPAVAATSPLPTASPAPGTPSDPDGMTDRARQLLVPVADPEPRPTASPSVAPVLPGRPAPQRPQTVRAPGEELGAHGGTPCPWCSTLNRPDRHFCARCAMPMAREAQAAGPLPWWRRLFAGNRETPWAGDRPRLRRTFDRVLTWLGAAVVLTLLTVLAFNIPKGVQATKDHFAKRASVDPDTWSASRSYQGHKPDLLGDKINNTWWGPGVAGTGEGQWIQAKFDEPTRLLDLIITPGVSVQADQIQESARPHRLKATITLSNGKTTSRDITLDPGAGGQRIPFRVGTVSAVRFTIESATSTSSKKQVSIAEIEFFGPSNANSS
ncbi:NADase-type glycan-binding domain-containing protein [Streptomyces sp. CA-249302]|uniref:NADase-type glycan-binding domain-containing protein n=1 Tax=Streptomyces sp. CA-249302 TaxID=3240058 RepID=UPI003D92A9BD